MDNKVVDVMNQIKEVIEEMKDLDTEFKVLSDKLMKIGNALYSIREFSLEISAAESKFVSDLYDAYVEMFENFENNKKSYSWDIYFGSVPKVQKLIK